MRDRGGVSPTGILNVAPHPALSPSEGERVVEDRVRGDVQLSTLIHTLYQQLWSPIEPQLPRGTQTVILSPDGALNFLSFATLLTPDDKFLSQKYSIRYISSGPDLLREFQVSPNADVTVFANPDFGGSISRGSPGEPTRSASINLPASGARTTPSAAASANPERSELSETSGHALHAAGEDARAPVTVRLREVEMRDFAGLHLPPLPGTAQESAFLEAHARKSNWPIGVFQGREANETQLHAVRSPRILHLATHGFFLPDEGAHAPRVSASAPPPKLVGEAVCETVSVSVGATPTGARETRALPGTGPRGVGGVRPFESLELGGENFLRPRMVLKNPMHRSGLALAGAQATVEAWQRGETAAGVDDGIVTAAEVGTLKLEGTELVVLSACDTGSVEAKSGEGVLGLRRGFIQAGAKNLLMTLWSVADEETAQLMAEFYERFHACGDAPSALADVQREWLERLRRERGLAEAVTLAGPFILSSQGTQPLG